MSVVQGSVMAEGLDQMLITQESETDLLDSAVHCFYRGLQGMMGLVPCMHVCATY